MSEVKDKPLHLEPDELVEITGYKWASKQLKVLHDRGFYRAEIDRFGHVSLERAHYEAVCRGAVERARPKVKSLAERRRS